MTKIIGFKCFSCGLEMPPRHVRYVCNTCQGNLDVCYDYKLLKKTIKPTTITVNHGYNIWRYFDLLPLKNKKFTTPLQVGWTPLYHSKKIGNELGLKNLFIKDDGRNPSASFKDRAGAIVAAHALEQGEEWVTGASTGNAASSLACIAAGLGLKTMIFVPQTAPIAKIAQLLVFGANVLSVRGNYDQAFELCLQATQQYGWYNRNTGYNPLTREGKKTCSYEIVEQLGWKSPDYVFVSAGDGNILSGIWKGFQDLYALGWIDQLPKMVAIQAEKSNSIQKAFENSQKDCSIKLPIVSGETIADSISVCLPRDGVAAVKALRESNGFALTITDEEILEGIRWLARTESIFAEPAGAITIMGLKKAAQSGRVKSRDKIVSIITGNGLKDVSSAMKAVGQPHTIEPTLDGLRQLLEKVGPSLGI